MKPFALGRRFYEALKKKRLLLDRFSICMRSVNSSGEKMSMPNIQFEANAGLESEDHLQMII